jgi:hypothetical protein
MDIKTKKKKRKKILIVHILIHITLIALWLYIEKLFPILLFKTFHNKNKI